MDFDDFDDDLNSTRVVNRYTCGSCGTHVATSSEVVPHCLVCNTPLCPSCNKNWHGLCMTHYNMLSERDKMRIANLDNSKVVIGGMIPFIIFMVAPLIFADAFEVAAGVFFFFMFALIFFIALSDKAKKDQKRRILQPYISSMNKGTTVPSPSSLGSPGSSSLGKNITPSLSSSPFSMNSPLPETKKGEELIVCSMCGKECKADMRFCPYCGSPLS